MKAINIKPGHTIKIKPGEKYHTIKKVGYKHYHIQGKRSNTISKVLLTTISGTAVPELDPDYQVQLSKLDKGFPP